LTLLRTFFIKAERLRHSFKELIDEYGEGEFPIKEMVEKLMTNTNKDDKQCLLPGIHPPEWEFLLSSIFVDTQLPLVSYKHIPLVCTLKLNIDFAFDTS
jgi:uncharacterized protein with NRDE domain